MTQALSDAVACAAKLPQEDQNALAAILMEEMASEERWSALFSESQTLLEQMARKAMEENQQETLEPIEQLT
jgi:hypothetical protein